MMNSVSNFYDTLDLKYPEIAIAMQDIDRINPGRVKFIIPILTPNMDTTKLSSSIIRQDTRNLMNMDTNLNINNISVTNFIEIPVPSELCMDIKEFDIVSGNVSISSNLNISNASLSGTGNISASDGYGSINIFGSVSGNFSTEKASISGRLSIVPTEKYRYIPKGSKWIVVFVGGDVTKPRIISRYLDD